MFFDLRLDVGRIEVADGDYSHQVRAIPVAIERAQFGRRDTHYAWLRSNGQPGCVARSLERDRQPRLEHPVAGALSSPPLLAHHSALVHHFGGVERLAVRPVLEDRKGLLDDSRGVCGDGQYVHRLVEARVRVQIRSEPHTDRLEILDQVILREMSGAVERGVLDDMGVPELVVGLEYGAGIDDEAKLGPLLGLEVLAYVVAQAVRKRADLHVRVGRQHSGQRRRRLWAGSRGALLAETHGGQANKNDSSDSANDGHGWRMSGNNLSAANLTPTQNIRCQGELVGNSLCTARRRYCLSDSACQVERRTQAFSDCSSVTLAPEMHEEESWRFSQHVTVQGRHFDIVRAERADHSADLAVE